MNVPNDKSYNLQLQFTVAIFLNSQLSSNSTSDSDDEQPRHALFYINLSITNIQGNIAPCHATYHMINKDYKIYTSKSQNYICALQSHKISKYV